MPFKYEKLPHSMMRIIEISSDLLFHINSLFLVIVNTGYSASPKLFDGDRS